mgnify:FL=1
MTGLNRTIPRQGLIRPLVELFHQARKQRDDTVDLLLGVVPAQAEPNRARGVFMRLPHG